MKHPNLKEEFKYSIYFGRSINSPDGKFEVTDGSVERFIQHIVAPIFTSFTYQKINGYWNGQQEKTFVITIIDERNLTDQITSIANIYKDVYQQEAVLVEISEVTTLIV